MTLFDRHPRLRWSVPAAASALIAAGAVTGLPGAFADDGLAPKTAEELLVELQGRTPVPLSGTVAASADLGLPALPMSSARRADMTALATGANTLRVWSDGPQRSRVTLLADSAQADVVRNGPVVWTWNSADNAADRYELPDVESWPKPKDVATPADLPSSPQEAAEMALAALEPTTEVSTSGVGRVAGRPVYELVFDPKQAGTLVEQVSIATDAETGVPLRVRVYSTQMADPAFEVGFTSVDFTRPEASVFEFTPPADADVTEHPAPDAAELKAARKQAEADADKAVANRSQPTVIGSGWSSVVITELDAVALSSLAPASGDDESAGAEGALALVDSLPTASGPWGSGRVLSGTLFSAIVTDDGKVAVGAVSPDALGAALADL